MNPQIAMIVITDDTFETCRRSTEYLSLQTIVDKVELVVVCPSSRRLEADTALLESFGTHRIVEVGQSVSTGQMLAAGVRSAESPYVFYVEEHNFPPPETAERVLAFIAEGNKVAVGLSMRPANPGLVAWAHLYGQFGHAVSPIESGEVVRLGGHHAVYSREILLDYGHELEDLLDNEAVLHEELRHRGVKLFIFGGVVVPHVQVSDFRTYLRHEYIAQRIFGSARASVLGWTPLRRLVYVLGSPLIPFLRTWRVLVNIRRTGRNRELLPQIIPVVVAGNIAGAIGEAMGYVFGSRPKDVSDRLEIELDRYAFVNKTDRERPKVPS